MLAYRGYLCRRLQPVLKMHSALRDLREIDFLVKHSLAVLFLPFDVFCVAVLFLASQSLMVLNY